MQPVTFKRYNGEPTSSFVLLGFNHRQTLTKYMVDAGGKGTSRLRFGLPLRIGTDIARGNAAPVEVKLTYMPDSHQLAASINGSPAGVVNSRELPHTAFYPCVVWADTGCASVELVGIQGNVHGEIQP